MFFEWDRAFTVPQSLCFLQGKGCGDIQLRMHYRALETLNQREMASAYKGVVTVRVRAEAHCSLTQLHEQLVHWGGDAFMGLCCCWSHFAVSACLQVMKISHLRDAKGRQPPAALIRVEVNDDFFRTRAIPTRNGIDYVYLVRALLTWMVHCMCYVYLVVGSPAVTLTLGSASPGRRCAG